MKNSISFRERGTRRYVDILTNGGFKALFGDVNNKDAVMSIINVLLPEHRRVVDIDYQPDWLHNEVYTRIFDACEIAGFTEDKRIKYDKDMYDEKRLQGEYAAYQRMGLEAGLKEGLEKGLEKGMEKGRSEVICSIHAKGISAAEIARMLDMDVSEIEKIISENS